MRVTVFWEDDYGVLPRGFGPHVLLTRCVADELSVEVWKVERALVPALKKGDSKLRAEIREGRAGSLVSPAVAVFDSDQIVELLGSQGPVPRCIPETVQRLAAEASGKWTIVLLERNVETLLDVAADVLSRPRPKRKLRPNARDELLGDVARGEDASRRSQFRAQNKSFDRLVRRVAALLRSTLGPDGTG